MRTRLSDKQLRILRHELLGDPLDRDPEGPAWSQPERFPPLPDAPGATDWTSVDLSTRCEEVWAAAVKQGEEFAAGVVVPPMVVSGPGGGRWVMPHGLVGDCSVWLDARHPFSKWLVKTKHASRYSRSKVQIYCLRKCQSALRARMYGLGVAWKLRRHRVPVLELTSRLD